MEKSTLSENRKQNLRNAYPMINWNFAGAIVHLRGFGDRISWEIHGTYKNKSVRFRHATPGGGLPTITINGKSIGTKLPSGGKTAAFCHASTIIKQIKKIV